jgi:hypothetical protein
MLCAEELDAINVKPKRNNNTVDFFIGLK